MCQKRQKQALKQIQTQQVEAGRRWDADFPAQAEAESELQAPSTLLNSGAGEVFKVTSGRGSEPVSRRGRDGCRQRQSLSRRAETPQHLGAPA